MLQAVNTSNVETAGEKLSSDCRAFSDGVGCNSMRVRAVQRCCKELQPSAERVGFEPTVSLHPRRFSRPLP